MSTNHYPKPGEKLDDHPISQIFPMMNATERTELAASIKKDGLREPIMLLDGKILDGRNRWEACQEAGVEPSFEFYDYRKHGRSPVDYVMDKNAHRRHLTPAQRAAIAAEAMPFYEAEAKERQRKSGVKHAENLAGQTNEFDQRTPETEESVPKPAAKKPANTPKPKAAPKTPVAPEKPAGEPASASAAPATPLAPKPRKKKKGLASDAAGAAVGVSGRAVRQAKRIQDENPEDFKKVKSGELSLSAAEAKLTAKQEAEQAQTKAMTRIEAVLGKGFADAVREGTRLKTRAEVLACAGLDDTQMTAIRGLLEDGWKVKAAVSYKAVSLTKGHKIRDLLDRAAAQNSMFTFLVDGWEVTVRRVEK